MEFDRAWAEPRRPRHLIRALVAVRGRRPLPIPARSDDLPPADLRGPVGEVDP